jgi:hypothetical protein
MKDLIKITPDKEKVRSILKMTSLIEERIKLQDKNKMAALIIVDYYEIIKELITARLLLDGYKTLSHKELINYISKSSEFNMHEISVLDNLRVLRNRVSYDGFFINPAYLNRNEKLFRELIVKLKSLIKEIL